MASRRTRLLRRRSYTFGPRVGPLAPPDTLSGATAQAMEDAEAVAPTIERQKTLGVRLEAPKPKQQRNRPKARPGRPPRSPRGMKRPAKQRMTGTPHPSVGCGPETVRCPDATNFKVATPECCRRWNAQILGDIARLFAAAKIRWWIDYGTLLGYCVGMLKDPPKPGLYWNDKDCDISVLAEDRPKVLGLMPKLRRLGYFVRYSAPHPEPHRRFNGGDRMKVCLSARNRTNTDIFFWFEDESGKLDRINYISVDAYKGREFPAEWALPTQVGQWEGFEVSIPAEPEKLVAHRYGENWRSLPASRTDGVRR